jgi:circadian clock protein KaiC
MERITTGIDELDVVTGGGLPAGSLVMLAGGPGTGKTTLAEQICFANATPARKAIYYTTLSEPPAKLVRHLEPFAFFDPAALGTRVEFINLEGLLLQDGAAKADGLGLLVAEVVRKSFEAKPVVIVIDSAKALRDFVEQAPFRKIVYELAGRVAHTGAVLLFVGEYREEEIEGSPEFSLADGILHLAYETHEPVDRRWLRVVKMRGTKHLEGKHTFEIGRTGLELFARLESIAPAEGEVVETTRVSSGIPELDEMMGGGMPVADVSAILGPSGSGKTVIALRYIDEGVRRGENCLYVSFQETTDQLVRKAASFGWDLASGLKSGQLTIYHVPPGNLNLDTVGAVVRAQLATRSVRRVAVDSLAELVFAAREGDRFPAYARSLVGFIRAAGASSMITSETTTLGPISEPLGGLSFLFHNVIQLRYLELESEVGRAIGVLKMRDSDHAKGLRQYAISEHGLTILGKLEAISGRRVLASPRAVEVARTGRCANQPMIAPSPIALAERTQLGRPEHVSSSACEPQGVGEEKADSRGMLRLMGLPHVARFPRATVTRHRDCFQLLFDGDEHSRRVDVDLRYIDDADDLEATELRLLARLQELGYAVERGLPSEGGAGS